MCAASQDTACQVCRAVTAPISHTQSTGQWHVASVAMCDWQRARLCVVIHCQNLQDSENCCAADVSYVSPNTLSGERPTLLAGDWLKAEACIESACLHIKFQAMIHAFIEVASPSSRRVHPCKRISSAMSAPTSLSGRQGCMHWLRPVHLHTDA